MACRLWHVGGEMSDYYLLSTQINPTLSANLIHHITYQLIDMGICRHLSCNPHSAFKVIIFYADKSFR